ncbi:MAG TPA: hypothetical protein PK082_08590 [Phycisphaerae bacterium]|nr:hypothetical protein [Phycisphaerae bacterium]
MILERLRYVFGYLHVPLRRWGQWRARRKLFRERLPVPLSEWAAVCGSGREWDAQLCVAILEAAGRCFGVDATRIRPEDRLAAELWCPWWRLQAEDFYGEINDAVRERGIPCPSPRPERPFDLEKVSIGEILTHGSALCRKAE